jgi:hypothetical protein
LVLSQKVVVFGTAILILCGTPGWSQPTQQKPGTETDPANTPESSARKNQRDENLKLMEKRAWGAKVRRTDKDKASDAKLISRPLFHYTDEPRRIVDATLWGWISEGRLLGICKIENYERGAHQEGEWLYCFGSLGRGLVDAQFADGHRWSARKPGIVLRSVPDAPPPGDGKPTRLRQMKELAGRVSATIVNLASTNTQEMRLLPRPIYRYEEATGELLDGTVFGLTTNGTNPDAILVVELHKSEEGALNWKFGFAGMTQEQLSVKFDGKEVWSKPHSPSTGSFDTWTFFWEDSK